MSAVAMSESEEIAILQEVLGPMCATYLDHHPDDSAKIVHERLRKLLDVTIEGLKHAGAGPIILYAKTLAREQFASGRALHDLLELCNLLEIAVWKRTLETADPGSALERVGRLSAIVGVGKDTLVQEYVSLLIAHRRGRGRSCPPS